MSNVNIGLSKYFNMPKVQQSQKALYTGTYNNGRHVIFLSNTYGVNPLKSPGDMPSDMTCKTRPHVKRNNSDKFDI